jgi:hypothetical protein
MFGIQLTTKQKLETAAICVILGIAGYFFFRSFFQVPFDTAINAQTLKRTHPVNDPEGNLPVTATNKADPKKDETVTMIFVQDGTLEIVKHDNDPSRHLAVAWTKAERRLPGLVYQYYRDPMAPVARIKDSFRHALAFATYKKVYEVPQGLGLLQYAEMTEEQRPLESEARVRMDREIRLIDAGVEAGTFHPDLREKVSKALDVYNAKPGSPTDNKVKADLARKLLVVANDYVNAILAEKNKPIDTYLTAMEKILTAEQKQKFIDGYKTYVRRAQAVSPGIDNAVPERRLRGPRVPATVPAG